MFPFVQKKTYFLQKKNNALLLPYTFQWEAATTASNGWQSLKTGWLVELYFIVE